MIGRTQSDPPRKERASFEREAGRLRVLKHRRKSTGKAWAMPTSSETFGLPPVASKRQAAESRMRRVMCSSR